MRLIGIPKLLKLKNKNKGNALLGAAIDDLIELIEKRDWTSKPEVLKDRPDADQVHPDGFYFFNLNVHRTLILLELGEEGEASVVWAGSHDDYELNFKNNKMSIKKWLIKKGWIKK